MECRVRRRLIELIEISCDHGIETVVNRDNMAMNRSEKDDELGDEARLKYKYRKLVMMQGVKMPARLAMKMVGPDCAYHLYRQHMPDEKTGKVND